MNADIRIQTAQRRVDILDNRSLTIQYNRNRYYDYYTGRWTTHDPLGILPDAEWPNTFEPARQYRDKLGLYVYVGGNPLLRVDAYGLYYISPESMVCCKAPKTDKNVCEFRRLFYCCCPRGWSKIDKDECSCWKAIRDTSKPGNRGRISQWATEEAKRRFKDDPNVVWTDGRPDAYRHCIWVCKLRQELGWRCAILAGLKEYRDWWKELGKGWTKERERMDHHNNKIGRKLGADCSRECTDSCWDALEAGELWIIKDGKLVPSDTK